MGQGHDEGWDGQQECDGCNSVAWPARRGSAARHSEASEAFRWLGKLNLKPVCR